MHRFTRTALLSSSAVVNAGAPFHQVGFAVHCYCWNQLPGNQGRATGGLSRKLRWRLRHNWRRMRGKVPEYAPFGDDELQGADLSLQDALVMAADDDSGEQVCG